MNKFEIVSDTSNDLPEEYILENNILPVSFYIRLDDENFLKDQIDIDRRQLYDFMRDNPKSYPKTSLPSVDDYLNQYRKVLDKNIDVLCFTVASSLSGSNQSANIAAQMAREQYPDRKIYVVDSRSASLGVGILIERAVDLRKEGRDLDDIREELEKIAAETDIYICLDTLSYLEQGGRISKVGARAGNLLKIKPIVSFKENKLSFETAVRGTKKAIRTGLDLLAKRIKEDASKYLVFVIHGDVEDLARSVKKEIEGTYNIKVYKDTPLVSATVISHIGPGAIGIGCMEI